MARLTVNLALATLFGAALGQQSVSTWLVSFWESPMCTGEGVGSVRGPSTPSESKVCNAIPNIGFVDSMTYEVASGEYTYVLTLHNTDDCSDTTGVYEGYADQSICVALDNVSHYSIQTTQTITGIGKRSPSGPETRRALAKRADFLTLEQFALAATIPAASWIDTAFSRCARLTATSDNVEKGECGMAIAYSAVFGTVSAWAIRGLWTARGQIQGRDHSLKSIGDTFASITSDGPVEFHDIVRDGYSTIVEALGSEQRHDGEWFHYAMNHTNRNDGYQHSNTLSHNPSTGQHHSSSLGSIVPDGNGIQARASTEYTATYAWLDGSEAAPLTQGATDAQLAAQLWNYGKQKNKSQFCADLKAHLTHPPSSPGPSMKIDQGNFALIHGTFTDYSTQC